MLYIEKIGKVGGIYSTFQVSEMSKDNPRFNSFVSRAITLFLNCRWGVLSENDRKANEEALLTGERIVGVYKNNQLKIYVIADAVNDDNVRHGITVMLSDEY